VNAAEHDPESPSLLGTRVQAAESENDPLPPENSTVPAGLPGEPASVSLTVAWHVVEPFTSTVDGEQLTLAEVVRFVAVTWNEPAEPW